MPRASQTSRRSATRRTLAVAATAALLQCSSVSARVIARNDTFSAFQSCLQDLQPVYPSSGSYGKDSAPFNQRLQYKPAAIVYPQDANGVSAAVKCAATSGYKVSARGGGHSYVAAGLGGEDGHLIISLDNLYYATVDNSTGLASIGGGTRLGNVALGLWQGGQRAMPHGVCPYVGAGGHLTMGGWGLDSRLYGLAMDMVESMTVVMADGTIANITGSDSDPQKDLFWAMRGAGPSFAIVTDYTAKTFDAPPEVYHARYAYNFTNAEQATQAYMAFQTWSQGNVPAELGAQLNLNKNTWALEVTYYGESAEANTNATMQSFWANAGATPTITDWTLSYIDSVKMLSGKPDQSLDVQFGKDYQDTFFATAMFVNEDAPLTEQAVSSFFQYMYNQGQQTNTAWFIQVDVWGGSKSAINAVSQDATSFWTRNALAGFQIYASTPNYAPPYPDADVAFVQGFKNSITSQMNGKVQYGYANYVDSTLSASEAQNYYWGGHAARLNQIKREVDPTGIFTNPQAFGRQ